MNKKQIPFDVLGNIVLVKFPKQFKQIEKKKIASKILKQHKSVKTILEKMSKFRGRLRKQETKHVLGEKTKEVLYRENGCIFRFNIDSTYFSPRLSAERKEIASKIKKNNEVLVMFSGVSPYGIVIAKNSKAKKVYSNEINIKASKYGELNVSLNKLKDRVQIVQGNIKRVASNFKKQRKKFDVIVMPRPQLKDSFLSEAFSLSKKGTRIFYYDFCKEDEISSIKEKILSEAKKNKKKIKILKIKKAGEIAPYRFRVRFDFKVV